ncbi:MAG: HYR domain-containing protein [Saprospiraceae bacterium]|nr:HYR domain-containing protein [Saprospiraceae bacterium]
MFKTLPLTVLGFLVGIGVLTAQVSFSVPNIESCPNQTTVSVPVTVSGFSNISAFSYSMEWNEAVLDFDSVGAFNLAYLDAPDFGTTQQANGIITTAWIDNDGVGKSRPNGTVIYRVYFTVIGPVGSTSLVQFKDNPTPIIAAQGFPPVVVPVTTIDGSVTRDDTVSPTIACPAPQTVNTAGPNAVVVGLAPNPADNCALASVTYSSTGATNISGANNASGSTFNLGTTTVTYVATDGEGNTANCAVSVTVNQVVNAVEFAALSDTALCADTTISIAVTTENFNLLTAFSFTLEWDETVIRYVSRTDLNTILPLTASNFGTSQTNNGIITVAWVDPMATGKTLPNGDTLFILNFIRQAGGGDESLIEFTDMPTAIVAAAFPAVPRPVVTVDGNAVFVDNPPVIVNCPANIVLNAAAGTCGQVATWTAPTATDNCDVPPPTPVRTVGPASGSTFPVGVTTITYIATDSKGQASAPCTFTVTVVDNQRPSITCPSDIDLQANASCQATLGDYTAQVTVTDNCPIGSVSLSQTPAPGTIISDTTVITMIATDAAGLKDTCTFRVNLEDNTAPAITCPATPAPVGNAAGLCTAVVALGNATATDNCSVLSITDNRPAGNVFNVGSTTVTFVATDVNGNATVCSVVVVVNDTEAPSISCPVNITQPNTAGTCAAVVNWQPPVVADNCAASVTVTCVPPSGTSFPVGNSTVMCIVADPSNNRDTCTFVVTITDFQAPLLDCPSDTIIEVPFGTIDTIINNIGLVAISDNCVIDTSYYHFSGAIPSGGDTGNDASGEAFPVGTTTVTYFGEDASGNQSSCTVEVTVVEVPVFSLTCPTAQLADNNTGSCFATIDTIVATVDPPANLASAFYILSGASFGGENGLDASGDFNVGITDVSFTAISIDNDTLTCSFQVIVSDTTAPAFTNCPSGTITLGNTIDSCGLVFGGSLLPTATDNCPGVSLDYFPVIGSLLPIGTNNITVTAIDMAGNVSSCIYSLEVIDNQPPRINNCPNGDTITVNADLGHCGAIVSWPAITADGNCNDVLSFTFAPQGPGTQFVVGITPVSYTAVDNLGNTAICTFYVEVEDNQAPLLICPVNQPPVNASLNQCSATVNFPAITATDNCGPVQAVPITPAGPLFDVGVHTVIYTATDAAGNTSSCAFTVTVVDNQLPFIPNMPADIVTDTDLNECGATVTWSGPGFPLDNCAIASFGASGGVSGDFFGIGEHHVIYVAFDVNGNITRDTLTITVEDNQAPEILGCPSGASISVDGSLFDDPDGAITSYQQMDCENITLFLSELIPYDDCGIASFVQTAGLPSGSAFPVGPNLFSFQAADNNGNISVCSFTINVLAPQITPASVAPTPVCEGEDVTFAVGGMPGASYLWVKGNQTVSNQQTFTLNNVTTSQGGIYTALVSMAFCDLEFDVNLVVDPVPVVTAQANDILCLTSGTPIDLTATNSSLAIVNNWTWTFPNGAVVSGQNQTIPNPTANSYGTYTVVATSNFGCKGSSSVTVDPSTGPNAPFLFGTDAVICFEEKEVVINGQLYSGNNVTYHWYAEPAANSGLIPINNPIVSVNPTAPGIYKYYFYVEVDGCVSDTAEWVLTVGSYPNVILQVIGGMDCLNPGSDVTLVDNGTGASSWEWSGPINLPPTNTNTLTLLDVSPAFNGTYTVVVSSVLGCSSSASVDLEFTMAPPTPTLTAGANVACLGSGIELTGTFYPGAQSYHWTGEGLLPNSQGSNVNFAIPGTAGTYAYTFAATDINGCTTETASINLTFNPLPAPNIFVTGETECLDGTTSITLSTDATGPLSYSWTDQQGNFITNNSGVLLSNVTSANSGSYFLNVQTLAGCEGFGSIDVVITDAISGFAANKDFGGCANNPLRLSASTVSGGNYTWFNPIGTPISSEQNPVIGNASDFGTSTYTVVVVNGEGCSASASVDVVVTPEVDANDGEVAGIIGVTQEFNMSDFVNIDYGQYTLNILNQPENGSVFLVVDSIYAFQPNPGFWGTDLMFVEYCNVDCPDECDVAKITFDFNYSPDECVVTNLISPNGDGANDYLTVSCAPAHLLNTLIVFNEWGDKVYEAAPYNNDWYGTNGQGNPLPDGTYFYLFQRDPDAAIQKGFVVIYR